MPKLPDDTATRPRRPDAAAGLRHLADQGPGGGRRATAAALEAGYRHLDTATVYGNEAEVGQALRDSGVARDDVFVTTKCPPNRAGRELDTLRRSLDALGTDHVDLWLIHWPGDGRANLRICGGRSSRRASPVWPATSASATSTSTLIDELTSATGTAPAVNQIEWSPLLFDAAVLEEHRCARRRARGLQRPARRHPGQPDDRRGSRSGCGVRPRRSSSAGISSTASSSSRSRATPTGSGPTPTSPASSCPPTTWPRSTVSAPRPESSQRSRLTGRPRICRGPTVDREPASAAGASASEIRRVIEALRLKGARRRSRRAWPGTRAPPSRGCRRARAPPR